MSHVDCCKDTTPLCMYNCEEYYEYMVFVGLPLFWYTIYHEVNNHITLFQHMDLKLLFKANCEVQEMSNEKA